MGKDRKRILCVEDDADTCELLTILLPDYELVNASTKSQAIEKARDGNFSLIFMDQTLPDGTGEETCRLIRTFDQITPILFLTGWRHFTEARARAIGAQGAIKKTSPTFIEDLQDRTTDLATSG